MKFIKNRKLKLDIFAAFSVLLTFAIASEIWYSTRINEKLMLDFEKEYYSKTTIKTTTNWLDECFNQLEIITSVFAKNFKQDETDLVGRYGRLFLETLKSIPYTLSVYMGFPDGRMFQARTLTGLTNFQNKINGRLPSYAKYALRTIEPGEDEKLHETWTYLNDDFGEIVTETDVDAKYNVSKLDWYVRTEFLKDKSWSDVYIFSSSKLPGVTLSIPLGYFDNSNAIGILAVDFAIPQFQEMLENVKSSPNMVSYLLNDKNEVVISSKKEEAEKETEKDGRNVRLRPATESGDPVLEKAVLTLLGSNSEHVAFSVDDVDYVASIKKLSKIDCSLLMISPQSDFTGNLKTVQKYMLLLSLGIYVLSFVIVWFISRRISNPISLLCRSAKAIGEMDLENYPTPPNSSITEIKQLSDAMNTMKLSVSTFSKYAPRDLVMRLMKNGTTPALGGQSKNITILFSDIEKFSTVSEKLPAEYLILHLSEYFDELTKEIMGCNGIIDKYIGDSIMAIWGAPNDDENQVVNACYAALRCQELLEQLKNKWIPLGKPSLPTRIGIHTGICVVGNIGSRDRMSFTAIGDNVNIASRLEGANKYYGTKILVSESVENIAKGKILFRVIDKIAVKGKSVGVTIYEPLCIMRDADNDGDYYEKIDLCSKSKEAFDLYQNMQFEEALSAYCRLLEAFPWIEVSVSPIIERCQKFKENPPENWNGTTFLTGK